MSVGHHQVGVEGVHESGLDEVLGHEKFYSKALTVNWWNKFYLEAFHKAITHSFKLCEEEECLITPMLDI